MVDIRGKWALVTGASRGIGTGIARGLAGLGCNLVLHSRSKSHLVPLEKELAGKGARVVVVAAELSEPAQVDGMMDEALAVSEGLDILVNNAAIQTPWRAPHDRTPAEDYRTSFEVNVISPIRITYRALPAMRERRWGRIVQLTSGIQELPELMAYAASKAALDKFVRDVSPSLRGTGVLMNLLDPGVDPDRPRRPESAERREVGPPGRARPRPSRRRGQRHSLSRPGLRDQAGMSKGPALRHGEAEVAPGIRLHYVESGEGPLVVLLHGFPDFWYGWRRQIPALAAAGFRVVAPDLRGYNLSSKPPSVRDYGIRTLTEDVACLIERLGEKQARVVGHDLGAGVAWTFAMAHGERVARLAVLNGPHPERIRAQLLRDPVQLARSWYMFFFQFPWLPEQVLRMDDFGILARSIRDEPKRPGAVTPEDVARYREAWARPGALTAMIAWYRALFHPSTHVGMRAIDAPVLVLWGEADIHLGPALAAPLPALVPNARVVMIPQASHWVQHDAAERVNEELVAFLAS